MPMIPSSQTIRNQPPAPPMLRTPQADPVAFGYIAVQHADEDEIEKLHDHLTAYAAVEGLALAEIFVDRNVIPGSLLRPGFDTLVTALKAQPATSVIVPSLEHLSPAASVRAAILCTLTELGATVVVAA